MSIHTIISFENINLHNRMIIFETPNCNTKLQLLYVYTVGFRTRIKQEDVSIQWLSD